MSVWSYGEGLLLFPKKARRGVKESLEISFDNAEYNLSVELDDKYESENYRRFHVKFSLCEDGMAAAKISDTAFKGLKTLGATDIYFNVDVRFLL